MPNLKVSKIYQLNLDKSGLTEKRKTYIPLPVPLALVDFIRDNERFVIVGHKEPDGDCIGSQLALASVLERLGKSALLCSAGPWKRPEILHYKDFFIENPSPSDTAHSVLIVTDCSNLERTGDIAQCLRGMKTAVIDHHLSANPFAGIEYVDKDSPAACMMVLELILALGLKPTQSEAELLFFGLSTDTGFFRPLDERSAEVFKFASILIEAGANPKNTFLTMSGGKTLGSRKLLALLLDRVEPHFSGRLMYTWELLGDREKFSEEGRDSDMLYQLIQSVDGVESILIIRQEKEDKVTVGLRSRDRIDVSKIAEALGGGGHKNAAGAAIEEPGVTIEKVKNEVFAMYEKIFDDMGACSKNI
jgi:phosphoesterase RecJ-like protein